MPKLVALIIISGFLTGCGVAKNPPFLADNFDILSKTHQKIAIVPSENEYTAKKRKPVKYFKNWQEQMLVSGVYLQKQFFLAMARKIDNGKVDLALQSFITTNQLLEQDNIDHTRVKNQNKAKLGKLLNVDALMICEFYYEMGHVIKRGLDGKSIRMAIPAVAASLYDTQSGMLIWRKKLNMTAYYSIDTPDRLARRAILSLVKRNPYVQQKGYKNRID